MLGIFRKVDWVLFIAVILLLGLSLAVLYPISQADEQGTIRDSHFARQIIFVAVGIVIFFALSFFDYRNLKGYSTVLFLMAAVLLALVLVAGKVVRGTSGWIGLGGFHIQPVELFKIVAAVALAKFFSLHSHPASDFKNVMISFVPLVGSLGLVLLQPDLGSAIVIVFLWFTVLILSGVRKKYLLIVLAAGLVLFLAWWLFFMKGYQKERITTLWDPFSDPLGSGYNVIQSTVAVGSGGFWGKGLGHGSQSQLNFLPEKHTDFIFAVIAEELGFGGAIFAMALLLVIVLRFIKIAQNSRDSFGKLLAGGLAGVIFVQSLINIGMNLGVVPVAGIPLPFLSYGGSSLVTMIAAAGIAGSIYRIGRR